MTEGIDPFGEEDALEALVDQLDQGGIFDEADRHTQARLETDPEWSRREWTHIHGIMEAWAYGVLSGDSWHYGYRLVENFEIVFNHVSNRLQEKFTDVGEVVEISLVEVRQWLGEWANEVPEYLAWNERGGSGIVSRYTPTPSKPQFIDLNVPPHNAAIWLRDQRRHERAFDRRFPLNDK